MGVMMQTFYWDCPREDGKKFQWWNNICEQVPALAKVGFTSLWLPPAQKAGNIAGPSMGSDPYDFYDLGEFDQKGSIPTWFGTRQELDQLTETAHSHGLSLIAVSSSLPHAVTPSTSRSRTGCQSALKGYPAPRP